MKTFYNRILEEFDKGSVRQKYLDLGISPIGYIDMYAGQEMNEGNFELFACPALLLEWSIDYSGGSIANVTFYLCYERLGEFSSISQFRDNSLKILDFINVTRQILNGLESPSTGKLNLVSENFHKLDSIVDVYVLNFECSYSIEN